METMSGHALILDMDAKRSSRIAELLRGQGYSITQIQGVAAALGVCASVPFSLLVVGDVPPDHERADVCRALRQMSSSALFVLASEVTPLLVSSLLDAGASDVLPKDLQTPEHFLLRTLVTQHRVAAQSQAEAMLRAMPDLVFRLKSSGEFLSFHAVASHDLFVPSDHIVGSSLYDTLPTAVTEPSREAIRRALATGELQVVRYSLDLPVGRRDFETRIVQSGPDEVLAIVRNTTDRRQVESLGRENEALAAEVLERRRASDALRASEAQWRSLVEGCPDYVVVIDREAVVRFVNRPIPEIDSGGVGKTVFEISPPHVHAEFREALVEVFEKKKLGALEIATYPGSLTAYEVRVAPISNDGVVTSAVILARDISDRRAAEAERAKMQKQLLISQKNDSLGLLAGGVAHDFNNLLTAILGSASVALLKLPEGSEARRAIETLVLAARRATDLTQQLLAYSGRGTLELRALDLSAQIRELVLVLEAAIPKQVALRLFLDRSLPAVFGDAGQMQQVVMNLVINAAEAIGGRSGTITLTTGVETVDAVFVAMLTPPETLLPGEHVFLEVRDDGCGMDAETFASVLDPFFSTKGAGRGLGLAAVHGIVRAHHGALLMKSERGSGATFKILLPVSSAKVEESLSEGPPPEQPGGTVLVVDDEGLLRRAACQIIEHFGYKALEAVDGRAAIETLKARPEGVDIVLLDMTMPGLSGEETFQELRRIRPDVAVVLSSGFNEVEATRRFGGEITAFLQKPYTAEQLALCLSKVSAELR